jgi:hypothetical protein
MVAYFAILPLQLLGFSGLTSNKQQAVPHHVQQCAHGGDVTMLGHCPGVTRLIPEW